MLPEILAPTSCAAFDRVAEITTAKRTAMVGFTLIELLVVISIIALLISVMLPALGQARKTARNMQCLTNTRMIGSAVNVYATDHRSMYPTNVVGYNNVWGLWGDVGALEPLSPASRPVNTYLNHQYKIASCPLDAGISFYPDYPTDFFTFGTSYGYPLRQSLASMEIQNGVWAWLGHRQDDVKKPSQKAILFDNITYQYTRPITDTRLRWHGMKAEVVANMYFADGHSAMIVRKDSAAASLANSSATWADIEYLSSLASTYGYY